MFSKRSVGMAVASVLSIAGAVFAAPAPAMAIDFEHNYVTASSAPTGSLKCNEIIGARVCFKADGDIWYVKDMAADSASAEIVWNVYDAKANLTRYGKCTNNLGNGTWGYCNKNYLEGLHVSGMIQILDYSNGKLVRQSLAAPYAN